MARLVDKMSAEIGLFPNYFWFIVGLELVRGFYFRQAHVQLDIFGKKCLLSQKDVAYWCQECGDREKRFLNGFSYYIRWLFSMNVNLKEECLKIAFQSQYSVKKKGCSNVGQY